jgi:hypothetical protein
MAFRPAASPMGSHPVLLPKSQLDAIKLFRNPVALNRATLFFIVTKGIRQTNGERYGFVQK